MLLKRLAPDYREEERQIIVSSGSEFRQFAFELVESRWFGVAILLVIFANTIFIGIQTSEYVVAKAGTLSPALSLDTIASSIT